MPDANAGQSTTNGSRPSLHSANGRPSLCCRTAHLVEILTGFGNFVAKGRSSHLQKVSEDRVLSNGIMVMGQYLPLAAANEFISRCPSGVSHMKLQKLVYMTEGSWLAAGNDNFLCEDPQVWQYGPVYQTLYRELRNFKAAPICAPQNLFDSPPRILDDNLLAMIDRVWAKYRDVSATRLSDITHAEGSPWHRIAKKYDFKVPMGTVIPSSLMRDYFRESANMAL